MTPEARLCRWAFLKEKNVCNIFIVVSFRALRPLRADGRERFSISVTFLSLTCWAVAAWVRLTKVQASVSLILSPA